MTPTRTRFNKQTELLNEARHKLEDDIAAELGRKDKKLRNPSALFNAVQEDLNYRLPRSCETRLYLVYENAFAERTM